MKRILAVVLAVVFIGMSAAAIAGEKAPAKVETLARTELVNLSVDPVIVSAVKAENAKGKSMAAIQEMDKKWTATPGVVDFMKAIMENECGLHLRQFQRSHKYIAEIFVMDNQGANVCMTDKTSDYWQGDEDKFKNSYNGGQGGIFIGEVEFDESTQTYVSQVSVPVMDGETVIGAITFGIDVEGF
ncbi:MAG: PDC sensor domain-containing protein [Proteobacteria bacterium]|nr:PDC sensor domain-containing protein [Pseudomonadota bacterium]